MGVDVAQEFAVRVVEAVRSAFGVELTTEAALVRPAAPGRGADLQSNVAMSLAKRVGRPSREVAARIAEALAADPAAAALTEPVQVDGPGFVNVTIRAERLGEIAALLAEDERAGVDPTPTPRRVVIDYSAPNVAKEMHVGHLRSTVIGDALARVQRFAGHDVIPQNHVGDWGTPFGMLIEHMIDEGWSAASGPREVADLNAFYQKARTKFDNDPAFAERARLRVVALQGGDAETLAFWRELVAESQRHFNQVYQLLDVPLGAADMAGESTYNPMLADVVAELERKGLVEPSDGALCVFPPGFTNRDGEPLPLIVRKRDGGYNYDTTDLAAIRYRTQELKADEMLYVVGAPQRLHFEMIFAAAKLAGWLVEPAVARHVGFGSVLGEDGRMMRTRAGKNVKLVDLLNEAIERAGEVLASRGEIPEADRARLARTVGIGAVKYADLSSDREKDYVFSFDRMLSLDGNTSVYLQYANARVCSVLRRAGGLPAPGTPVVVAEPAERALVLKLARLGPVLDLVMSQAEPHRLATWLYETAVVFSAFYESCPILTAEPAIRDSRLLLARATSRALTVGLNLLGIEAPERL
jgi:arginyl-tRNA synthetase